MAHLYTAGAARPGRSGISRRRSGAGWVEWKANPSWAAPVATNLKQGRASVNVQTIPHSRDRPMSTRRATMLAEIARRGIGLRRPTPEDPAVTSATALAVTAALLRALRER